MKFGLHLENTELNNKRKNTGATYMTATAATPQSRSTSSITTASANSTPAQSTSIQERKIEDISAHFLNTSGVGGEYYGLMQNAVILESSRTYDGSIVNWINQRKQSRQEVKCFWTQMAITRDPRPNFAMRRLIAFLSSYLVGDAAVATAYADAIKTTQTNLEHIKRGELKQVVDPVWQLPMIAPTNIYGNEIPSDQKPNLLVTAEGYTLLESDLRQQKQPGFYNPYNGEPIVFSELWANIDLKNGFQYLPPDLKSQLEREAKAHYQELKQLYQTVRELQPQLKKNADKKRAVMERAIQEQKRVEAERKEEEQKKIHEQKRIAEEKLVAEEKRQARCNRIYKFSFGLIGTGLIAVLVYVANRYFVVIHADNLENYPKNAQHPDENIFQRFSNWIDKTSLTIQDWWFSKRKDCLVLNNTEACDHFVEYLALHGRVELLELVTQQISTLSEHNTTELSALSDKQPFINSVFAGLKKGEQNIITFLRKSSIDDDRASYHLLKQNVANTDNLEVYETLLTNLAFQRAEQLFSKKLLSHAISGHAVKIATHLLTKYGDQLIENSDAAIIIQDVFKATQKPAESRTAKENATLDLFKFVAKNQDVLNSEFNAAIRNDNLEYAKFLESKNAKVKEHDILKKLKSVSMTELVLKNLANPNNRIDCLQLLPPVVPEEVFNTFYTTYMLPDEIVKLIDSVITSEVTHPHTKRYNESYTNNLRKWLTDVAKNGSIAQLAFCHANSKTAKFLSRTIRYNPELFSLLLEFGLEMTEIPRRCSEAKLVQAVRNIKSETKYSKKSKLALAKIACKNNLPNLLAETLLPEFNVTAEMMLDGAKTNNLKIIRLLLQDRNPKSDATLPRDDCAQLVMKIAKKRDWQLYDLLVTANVIDPKQCGIMVSDEADINSRSAYHDYYREISASAAANDWERYDFLAKSINSWQHLSDRLPDMYCEDILNNLIAHNDRDNYEICRAKVGGIKGYVLRNTKILLKLAVQNNATKMLSSLAATVDPYAAYDFIISEEVSSSNFETISAAFSAFDGERLYRILQNERFDLAGMINADDLSAYERLMADKKFVIAEKSCQTQLFAAAIKARAGKIAARLISNFGDGLSKNFTDQNLARNTFLAQQKPSAKRTSEEHRILETFQLLVKNQFNLNQEFSTALWRENDFEYAKFLATHQAKISPRDLVNVRSPLLMELALQNLAGPPEEVNYKELLGRGTKEISVLVFKHLPPPPQKLMIELVKTNDLKMIRLIFRDQNLRSSTPLVGDQCAKLVLKLAAERDWKFCDHLIAANAIDPRQCLLTDDDRSYKVIADVACARDWETFDELAKRITNWNTLCNQLPPSESLRIIEALIMHKGLRDYEVCLTKIGSLKDVILKNQETLIRLAFSADATELLTRFVQVNPDKGLRYVEQLASKLLNIEKSIRPELLHKKYPQLFPEPHAQEPSSFAASAASTSTVVKVASVVASESNANAPVRKAKQISAPDTTASSASPNTRAGSGYGLETAISTAHTVIAVCAEAPKLVANTCDWIRSRYSPWEWLRELTTGEIKQLSVQIEKLNKLHDDLKQLAGNFFCRYTDACNESFYIAQKALTTISEEISFINATKKCSSNQLDRIESSLAKAEHCRRTIRERCKNLDPYKAKIKRVLGMYDNRRNNAFFSGSSRILKISFDSANKVTTKWESSFLDFIKGERLASAVQDSPLISGHQNSELAFFINSDSTFCPALKLADPPKIAPPSS